MAAGAGLAYKRILLKLSGEALMGDDAYGINPEVVARITAEIAEVAKAGVEIGLVVGAGNIFRGVAGAADGMDRAKADAMGMLGTVINAMALENALNQADIPAILQSAIPMPPLAAGFDREAAIRALEAGTVVVFGAGTGNPFFTTDTAASLRGLEINADIVLKATKVDGVYDKDPIKHDDAVRFDVLSYDEVLERRLGVMDVAAIALCRDAAMPLKVFSINTPGALARVVWGENEGTLVQAGASA